MKHRNSLNLFAVIILAVCFFTSCKKDNGKDNTQAARNINDIVPQPIIDSMKNWGFPIYEGDAPPTINGIYLFSPDLCMYDNSGNNDEGYVFADYKYKFYDQDNKNFTLKLDYKAGGANDSASGRGAFIAGTGNSFTAYLEVSGSASGVSYKRLDFYSGEITATGITNFRKAFYMKEKGPDPSGILINVGTSRIFTDEDGFSEKTATFTFNAGERISGTKKLQMSN